MRSESLARTWDLGPNFRLQVALLMAGASVTGAVFGILAGSGLRHVDGVPFVPLSSDPNVLARRRDRDRGSATASAPGNGGESVQVGGVFCHVSG